MATQVVWKRALAFSELVVQCFPRESITVEIRFDDFVPVVCFLA